MTYIFGDLGRSWSFFRDLGSKGKILLGSRGNYFQGSGEINALFSGIKGAQTTPTPGGASKVILSQAGKKLKHYISIIPGNHLHNIFADFAYDMTNSLNSQI